MDGRLAEAMCVCLLFFSPVLALAGVNKCTNAEGVVSYSDQPCISIGQAPVAGKASASLAAANALENQTSRMDGCVQLSAKRSECGLSLESHLNDVFRKNCEGLIQKASIEKRQVQNSNQRRLSLSHSTNAYSYSQEEPYYQKPVMTTTCGSVNNEIFNFVKLNFSDTVSAEEMKVIEYNHLAVPSNGRESDYNDGRRRRR